MKLTDEQQLAVAEMVFSLFVVAVVLLYAIVIMNAITVFTEPRDKLEPVQTAELVMEPQPELLGNFEVTAYCPCERCCGAWADGITYTGGRATENQTIAVDPKVIELGSVLEINGQQYVAEDIGGAIKQNRIDIFFTSHEEALKYGVQNHDVYLIKEV